jgi:pilus assembly protein Flp/PilA
LLNGVYAFTVNFGFDLFTNILLIRNCASVDLDKGAIDMLNKFRQFLKNESGSAAVEYGLITSGISVAVIPSVTGVGNKLVTIFTTVQTAL